MSILIRTLLPGDVLDLRVDAHAVLAAREVLLRQVLLSFVEHRAVEGLAGRESHVAQGLLQVLGLDVLVARDLEALDRRPLQHHHDEARSVAADLHVTEETRRVQRANRLPYALRREGVPDVHGQIVEDRAFGNALEAFDLDVADREVRVAQDLALRRSAPAGRATSAPFPSKGRPIAQARARVDRLRDFIRAGTYRRVVRKPFQRGCRVLRSVTTRVTTENFVCKNLPNRSVQNITTR